MLYRTLLLLDDFLSLDYSDRDIILRVENSNLSLSLEGSDDWIDVSITITPDYVSLYSTLVGYTSNQVSLTIPAINSITIGMSYPDLLQDFIIYDMPLNDSSPHPLAAFVSQCYCTEGFNPTSDECVNDDGTESPR